MWIHLYFKKSMIWLITKMVGYGIDVIHLICLIAIFSFACLGTLSISTSFICAWLVNYILQHFKVGQN